MARFDAGRGSGKNAFRMLLSSSFIVALVPMLASILASVMLIVSADRYMDQLHTATAESMLGAFRQTIGSAYSHLYSHAGSNTIQEYSSSRRRNYWTELKIHDMLLSSSAANGHVKSLCLYLKQYDCVLSDGCNLQSELYCRINGIQRRGEWLALLMGSDGTMRTTTVGDSCLITKEVYHSNDDVCQAVLAMEMDMTGLRDALLAMARDPGDGFVLYVMGEPFLSALSGDSAAAEAALSGPELPRSVRLDGAAYRVYACGNRSESYRLVYLRSADGGLLTSADGMRMILLLSVCLLVTVAICVRTALRNYSPIKRISAMLDLDYASGADGASEYDRIEQSVQRFDDQLKALKQTLNRHAAEFQTLYLEKLLMGRIPNANSIQDGCELYNLRFPAPKLMLLLIDPDAFLDANASESLDTGKLIVTITELLTRMIGPEESMYILSLNSIPAFLLNVAELSDIRERVDAMFASMQRLTGVRLAFAASDGDASPEGLPALYQRALEALEQHPPTKPDAGPESTESVNANVENCLNLIKRQYADSQFGVSEMADALGLNASYISRCFKQQIGMGLLEYINRYRVSIARKRIAETPEMRIRELAAETGFNSEATLIRVFKKYEGMTPGQFKAMLSQSDGEADGQ